MIQEWYPENISDTPEHYQKLTFIAFIILIFQEKCKKFLKNAKISSAYPENFRNWQKNDGVNFKIWQKRDPLFRFGPPLSLSDSYDIRSWQKVNILPLSRVKILPPFSFHACFKWNINSIAYTTYRSFGFGAITLLLRCTFVLKVRLILTNVFSIGMNKNSIVILLDKKQPFFVQKFPRRKDNRAQTYQIIE